MSERKGKISVQTTDILPIIKKWLYSEHDIFLRELVANGSDAITKRATVGRTSNQEVPTPEISVKVDKENKTVTISDNGIGMTEDEVEKYIAQLAFSGAEEFVKKLETEGATKGNEIIGKFGLGFYSAFMVADKVEVESLSMTEGATATKWTCEGESDYTFTESDKKEVGTAITLHINDESKEFLELFKVKETMKRHCDFMPYPIHVLDAKKKEDDESQADSLINETNPLWKRDPSELKDEDYKEFYRKLYPFDQEPLFWLHLKVDHPFTLEGILYFPKLNRNKPFNENNIRLYSKQVFVSDNVKNIIPDFLSLLKGTIDSTDIPLNVSRSSLQGDPNIRKISNYIIKKVAESLKKLYKNDREKLETIWEDIGLFIKYGCISEPNFDEKMRETVLFKNSENKFMTLSEYRESVPEKYKEKMADKVLYFEKGKSDYTLREQLLSEGIQTIETEDHIDPHFMQHAESRKIGENEWKFASLDSEVENLLSEESTSEDDVKIKELFQKLLVGEVKEDTPSDLEVEIKKIKNSKSAAYFKVDEQMKRFQQMAKSMGQDSSFPVKKTLVINPGNPLIQNALKIHEKGNEDLVKKLCQHVQDLASLSSNELTHEERDSFIQRSQTLVQELSSFAL